MPQVTTSAPGKLLLFGDHAVVYGHPCIVTAVDQRIQVSVRKNGVDVFAMDAPDLGLKSYSKTIADLGKKELPKSVSFMEMLYKRFLEKYPQDRGIVVTTKSEFSSQFGFGSSSAVTVAFAKALVTLYELDFTQHQLFELCYQAVIDVQGVGSGFDIASAVWGGTLYYVKPAAVVEQIEVKDLPLIVGYSGVKADTPTLIRMVESLRSQNPEKINGIFSQVGKLVESAREAIAEGNWPVVGKLMTQNQQLLRQLQVSSVLLDGLIAAATQSGASGAKLSGAGGGDCMVAIATEEHSDSVEAALRTAGAQIMRVKLHAEGVRVESQDLD